MSVPVSESQFVEWVQGSGGVILVSPVWLQEVLHFYLLPYCHSIKFDIILPSVLCEIVLCRSVSQSLCQSVIR